MVNVLRLAHGFEIVGMVVVSHTVLVVDDGVWRDFSLEVPIHQSMSGHTNAHAMNHDAHTFVAIFAAVLCASRVDVFEFSEA